jgi:hypothetical protein
LAGHAVKLSWDLFVLGVDDKEKKKFYTIDFRKAGTAHRY